MKKKATFFALLTFLLLSGIRSQEFTKVTVNGKTRQAQIIETEIDGQKSQGLLLYAQNAWYKVSFSQKDLQAVRLASEKYFSEFEAKKLKKGKKETLKKYGSISTFVEWGSDKNSIDRFSDTNADLGYIFVKQAPYFLIKLYSAQNKNPERAQLAYQNSSEFFLLFTRTQLKELLDKIN